MDNRQHEKQTAEAAYALQQQAQNLPPQHYGGLLGASVGSAGPPWPNQVPSPPIQPITAKVHEALQYLAELDKAQIEMRIRMLGSFPQPNESVGRQPGEPHLDELLTILCQKAAALVSEARALLSRL